MSFSTEHDSDANSAENLTNFLGEFGNYTMPSFADDFTEELAYVLNVFFTPALVVLGTVGNLLSIIVFYRGKLRVQSTSQYMSALAISDTIFLLQLIPPWLNTVTVSRVFARQGFCQCFVYLTYVSSSSSSWLVVSFTIERFVAVLYPLQRTRMCTVRRARITILGITFLCLAINTPVLKFAVPKGNDCNIDYDMMDHAARFNVLDTIFSFTLPLAIITVLNIWIMIGVCRLSRARGHLIKEEQMQPRHVLRPQTRAAAVPGRRGKGSLQRSQQRITRMLLIVSSVFVLLNLPAYSMRIVAYANNMSSYEYNGKWAALQQICLLFFNSNFGINFFLYCMTGQNFRRALCQTFSCFALRWTGLKLLFCCWAENAQRPRPSVTNSLSINTEASAAASRVSIKNAKKGASSLCKDAYGSYVELWRFDNSRQEQQKREQYEMQVFPVHSYRFASDRLERPVPRWPENTPRHAPPECAQSPALPGILASLTFRPIQSNLEPGQDPPDRTPGLESPPLLVNTRSSSQAANVNESPLPPSVITSPLPENANIIQLPSSPLGNEIKSLDVPKRLFKPFARPQPPRKFSLPARQLHVLERIDTPTPLINVPARRCPIQPPPARSPSLQAPAAPHAVLPES